MAFEYTMKTVFRKASTKDYNGHTRAVHCVAWNCTGRKLASGSVDKTARVWMYDTNKQRLTMLFELSGHQDTITQVCWNPKDPDMLATASGDKSVRIWNAKNGKCIKSIATSGENINLAWSPDGKWICVGNKKDVISFIDTNTYEISIKKDFSHEVNEMCWSNDMKYFLLTSGHGTVDIHQFPSLQEVHRLQAHTGTIYALEMDRKGAHLATAGADAITTIWNTDELTCNQTIARFEKPVRTISFSHDGKLIASGSEESIIDIASVLSGLCVHSFDTKGPVNAVAWNPRYMALAYASDGAAPVGLLTVPK